MKKTLKQLALLPLFFGLLAMVACGKDDDGKFPTSAFDGKITAVVENGNAYNSVVSKVVVMLHWHNENGHCIDEEIANSNYSNGNFTLTLPILDPKTLEVLAEDAPQGIKISDEKAKIGTVYREDFHAYNNSGNKVGEFFYGKYDGDFITSVSFMYADRDVTITGSVNDDGFVATYNVSLKKGWNKVYMTTDNRTKAEISTKEVSGVKWYFQCERCEPDVEPVVVTAIVENGNDYNSTIGRVRAAAGFYWGWSTHSTLAQTTYSNGGFALILPTVYNLINIEEFFGGNISNRNARIEFVMFEGFSSTSGGFDYYDWVGDFFYGKFDGDFITQAVYMFVDRDVTITGTNDEGGYLDIYDVVLKRGWNRLYWTYNGTQTEITTNPISGLKWYWEEDWNALVHSSKVSKHAKFALKNMLKKNTKSALKQNTIFSRCKK
ncbi:MAG: hypothetical protein LBH22_02145 [Bacteroidales bacterium]|jgi:hypothetical protein|nr:hypothetical protein [Bacteroidales bacterium]